MTASVPTPPLGNLDARRTASAPAVDGVPAGSPSAPPDGEGSARPSHASPEGSREHPAADTPSVVRAIGVLADRIGDLEDAVAEAVEEIGKVRKAIGELREAGATKKQLKKVKKILDQLEVIEVGPEDAPAKGSGKDR